MTTLSLPSIVILSHESLVTWLEIIASTTITRIYTQNILI